MAVYGALGFMFGAFGFGFFVGFRSRDSTHRCIAASVLLITAFLFVRVSGVNSSYMRPFATGAMCLGNIMYFLGLLIVSSKWHCSDGSYVVHQVLMLGSLVVAMLLGSVFGVPSMANTATTFLVL